MTGRTSLCVRSRSRGPARRRDPRRKPSRRQAPAGSLLPLVFRLPPARAPVMSPKAPWPLAPCVSLTFSAPMVPITSLDDLSKMPVPIRITPEPPGKWRWVGTQTAMFQPDGRFPMATDYAIDVPAGTRSVDRSNVLAEAQHFAFATPPPKLVEQLGPKGGPVRLDPIIYARFDQAIDPRAVLAAMTVNQGSQRFAVRLATQEEMAADKEVMRHRGEATKTSPLPSPLGRQGAVELPWRPNDARRISRIVRARAGCARQQRRAFLPGHAVGRGPAEDERPRTRPSPSRAAGPMRVAAERLSTDCNPFSPFSGDRASPTRSMGRGIRPERRDRQPRHPRHEGGGERSAGSTSSGRKKGKDEIRGDARQGDRRRLRSDARPRRAGDLRRRPCSQCGSSRRIPRWSCSTPRPGRAFPPSA